ncbi:unnamed protein product [Anisakis simplex]|uniref:AMPK1_CBM domain-containing protein n=1 Tax=Anisakis simplex TaxID=6269 RepID=A0A0M3KDJ2_ANISI|nr:unnamed protein product [Anisakis simplex]
MEHVTAMKDRLQKADRAESEHKTTIARLEKDLADAKSKLAAAESSEDAELKCVHCAAASLTANRLPSSNGSDAAAVVDVDSAMSQKTSAYNHKANTLTTNAQHHQNASLHSEETNDATDSEAPNATIAQTNGSTDAKQKVQSDSAAPSAAPAAATHLQGVAGGTELDDGASEEENIVALQDAPESNMQNLDSATKLTVRFELKWPVPDWSRADAPKERCADGFKLDVELLAPGEGDCANRTPSSKGDSERVELIADREGGDHKKRYEFKFLVDGEWRCTEHYAKMLTDNGAFENNIVYV